MWSEHWYYMSSVFEMFTLSWLESLPLCWQGCDATGWFEIVIHDVWCAEDDNTCFLSVGLDDLGQLYLKELPISLPIVPISTIPTQNMVKKYYVRKIDKNRNMCNILMNNQNIMFVISLPYEKSQKIRN